MTMRGKARTRMLFATLGFSSLLFTQSLEAARPACISPGDMRVILRMALPDAIEALTDRCKAVLPADAFLPNEGAGLAARYRSEAPVDPARVRRAVEAATGQDLSGFASDETVATIAHQFVDDQIASHVPPRKCGDIDGMVALAAPLHAGAMTEAILVALQIAGPEQTKGLAICPPKDEGADR